MSEWEDLARRAHMAMLVLRGLAPEHADINAAPGSAERLAAATLAGVERWLADYERLTASDDNEGTES